MNAKFKKESPTYATLTDEMKKAISGLYELYATTGIGATDPGHAAACIAADLFGINNKKCTKRDANAWSAVLTHLIFIGKIKTR